MTTIQELIGKYYQEFVGLPSHRPIVRNHQENDAFELVVLKTLYGKNLPEFTKSNAVELSNYIIAPPDNGIDIFYQHEDGDECSFDVIQVKNASLDENDLRNAILGMQRTIEDYCKNPMSVKSESCREILSNSNLDKLNRNRCHYFVVHTGSADDFSGSHENEHILTHKSLEILYSNASENVDKDELPIQTSMNYGQIKDNHGAVVCTLNGFDLAQLNNTYYSTEVGRNILFGSNLRESLITKNSKPYRSMSETITECPSNFWYYNNGITIIAKDIQFDSNDPSKVLLKNFSIVNGAQTTSSLGLFLREAKKNHNEEHINCLKQVYVLTRILKVSDDNMRENIAIYNNTQNPITSRDMVTNRPEQKKLYKWLIDETYPQIFCEIRRGSQPPSTFNKGISHRKTTNEALAQVAYAYFLQQPFTAKDKKSALFNKEYQTNSDTDYVINKIYHDIFYWETENSENNGLIFQKEKTEIDEALFVQQLYKEAKKLNKASVVEKIEKEKERKNSTTKPEEIRNIEARIEQYSLHKDTAGICMFYFLSLYYEFKITFDNEDGRLFNYDKYYADKAFRQKMIESASSLFLSLAVKLLVKTAKEANKAANVNNWVRSQGCEAKFLEALREELASDFELEDKYKAFVADFKV